MMNEVMNLLPRRQTLSRHWFTFQRELFPRPEAAVGPLGERCLQLVRVLELLAWRSGWRGRPPEDRAAPARAFPAKAVPDVAATRALVERLRGVGKCDERDDLLARLWRVC